tara:strand:+ start:216 stop:965 length:750 start_codon:yes stop_codon:yes gene_type:complete
MALKEKMQQLRESVPQAGKEATRDAPSTYRINAINPAQDIDDQWALIDTPHNYGSRGPHQGVRKIRVGDELPQGSVVSITAEGIQVLPNFEGSEEYVVPMGSSSYEPPPGEKTEPEAPTVKELIEEEKGRREYERQEKELDEYLDPEEPLYIGTQEYFAEQTQDALADAGDGPEMIGLGVDTISPFSNFNRAAKRQRMGEAIEGVQSGSDLRQYGPLKTFEPMKPIEVDWPEPLEPFDEEAIRRAAESL